MSALIKKSNSRQEAPLEVYESATRYALYYQGAPMAYFATALGARLFAKGVYATGWLSDSSQVKILDMNTGEWILIEHLLTKAAS